MKSAAFFQLESKSRKFFSASICLTFLLHFIGPMEHSFGQGLAKI